MRSGDHAPLSLQSERKNSYRLKLVAVFLFSHTLMQIFQKIRLFCSVMNRFNQPIDLSTFDQEYTVIYLEPSFDALSNSAVYSRHDELNHLFNEAGCAFLYLPQLLDDPCCTRELLAYHHPRLGEKVSDITANRLYDILIKEYTHYLRGPSLIAIDSDSKELLHLIKIDPEQEIT